MREWRYSVNDCADGDVTISDVPCLVTGWTVNTAITSECTLKDDSTVVVRLPAGTPAGDARDYDGLRFETNLKFSPSGSGEILVLYDELERS